MSPFTVPRRVLVPLIDRVDLSTSDAEPPPPPPPAPSMSSLCRLLLIEILSSSSSHARTACEGMRLRLVVGVVTPNDFVKEVMVAVEVEALLLPALLLALLLPPLLLMAEG